MSEMAEDRIYDDPGDDAEAYVAAAQGVVVVSVSGDRVGRFSIDRRCRARDVAADADRVVVATDEDVLVANEAGYRSTEFGPAVAVGVDAGDPVAAAPDGRIGRRVEGEWFDVASVDAAVRAIEGDLVGAADGVYRADPDGLDYVGLEDARDVASAGPYAATGDGLYELGNGWLQVRAGTFDAVAADGPAHAAGESLLARVDGEWVETGAELPGTVAGIAHAGGTYAVTDAGTVLAHAGDGSDDDWRRRSLGVGGVGGIAIPGQ